MTKKLLALNCDYDYRNGGGFKPIPFMDQINSLKRYLEDKVNVKQIGLGLFVCDPSEKEKFYEVTMDMIDGYVDVSFKRNMVFSLMEIIPADEDFHVWKQEFFAREI